MDLTTNSNSNQIPFLTSKNAFNIFNIKSPPISMLIGDNDYLEEFLNIQNEIEENNEDSPNEKEEEEKKNFVVFDPEPIIEEQDFRMRNGHKDNDEFNDNIKNHSINSFY